VASDNAHPAARQPGPPASDNRTPAGPRRRGRAPAALPPALDAVHAHYAGQLAAAAMLDPDTRRAYASRVRGYLAWLEHTDTDGDPLTDPAARDGAVRDYRTWLQTTARCKPATINTILAALADFYTRARLGPPDAKRLDLPQRAPAP
jgi:Phage integrase, N-terminal SAM-like domain